MVGCKPPNGAYKVRPKSYHVMLLRLSVSYSNKAFVQFQLKQNRRGKKIPYNNDAIARNITRVKSA